MALKIITGMPTAQAMSEYNKFEAQQGVIIQAVTGSTYRDNGILCQTLFIQYETSGDRLAWEQFEQERHKALTKKVDREKWASLKSEEEKLQYLVSIGINTHDGKRIITLLKPQMAFILNSPPPASDEMKAEV